MVHQTAKISHGVKKVACAHSITDNTIDNVINTAINNSPYNTNNNMANTVFNNMTNKIFSNIGNKIFGLLSSGLLLSILLCGCGAENSTNKSSRGEIPVIDNSITISVEDSIRAGNAGNDKTGENNRYDADNKDSKINNDPKFYDNNTAWDANPGNSCFMQPILQNPTTNTVTVEWFTEDEGSNNRVLLYGSCADDESSSNNDSNSNNGISNGSGDGNVSTGNDVGITDISTRTIKAETFKLSRIRGGKNENNKDDASISCTVYKHVAVVDMLPEYHGLIKERSYYRVATDDKISNTYSLAAAPAAGTPMRILLTSDHQGKDMVAANIQKAYETVGLVDAVFMNGDLVDVTDRGYDWFYSDNAFFKVFGGTACDKINGKEYCGAPLLQYAPMYTSIGNHDVMGVFDNKTPLSSQFNEPRPKEQAEKKWAALTDREGLSHDDFIRDNSYNTITYEELFENPKSSSGGEKYYAVSIGDIRLITLDVSRVWRLQNIGLNGKYSEIPGAYESSYSGGDFIFESIKEGSPQIDFLDKELKSKEFSDAKIKIGYVPQRSGFTWRQSDSCIYRPRR